MSLALVFVPDTALLVPGAAGRAEVLAELREQAVAALARATADSTGRTLVIAPGAADRVLVAPVTLGLGAAGIPDAAWATGDALARLAHGAQSAQSSQPPQSSQPSRSTSSSLPSRSSLSSQPSPSSSSAQPNEPADPPLPPGSDASGRGLPSPEGGCGPAVADVAGSTALVLLALAGADATAVDVVEVGRHSCDPAALRHLGARLAASPPAIVVVVGSLSARHGPDAPLADDPRAPGADARLLEALGAGETQLSAALDDLGATDAAALAVTGWGPWHVASGLVRAWSAGQGPLAVDARVHLADAPLGAQHAVASWQLRAERAPGQIEQPEQPEQEAP